MSWNARALVLLVLWVVAFSAFGGGPDYDAFSDRSGRILDDEQHTPAFQAMVRHTAQLEAIHADAMKADPRAAKVFEELERVYFPFVGREVAELEGRKACLVPGYRELSGTCIPNWRGLDFLPKDTEMGVRLRKAVADAYAARARELGIENRAILSAVNALLAVGVVNAALRPGGMAAIALKPSVSSAPVQPLRAFFEKLRPVRPRSVDRIDVTPGARTIESPGSLRDLGLTRGEVHIYVVTEEGRLVVAPRGSAKTGAKHTELTGGAPVKAAGELRPSPSGGIELNSRSGRYSAQDPGAGTALVQALKSWGLEVKYLQEAFP